MNAYTSSLGITQEFANVGVPADNGFAERRIRTLVEHARAMLVASNLPSSYWCYAISYTCYVQNKVGRRSFNYASPHEKLFHVKPNLQKLAIFGQICYAKKQSSDKFAAKSFPAIYLGHDQNVDAHIVQTLDDNQILSTRDVVFPPTMFINEFLAEKGSTTNSQSPADQGSPTAPIIAPLPDSTTIAEIPTNPSTDPVVPVAPIIAQRVEEVSNVDETTPESSQSDIPASSPVEPTIVLPEPTVEANLPDTTPPDTETTTERAAKLDANKNIQSLFRSSGRALSAQTSYNSTLKGDLAPYYEQARRDEWNKLVALDAFEIVDRPNNSGSIIRSQFVHTAKCHSDGSFERFKARLVANGNEQTQGVNYTETYAPTPSYEIIRLLLSIAAQEGWAVGQADVQTAYVHAPLSEEIHIEIPKGAPVIDRKNKVLKLKKALYGLKQAGREWSNYLRKCLTSFGWKVNPYEPCLFRRNNNEFLLIYVDDILIFGKDQANIDSIRADLNKYFPVKDLGPVHDFLGMEIHRDEKNKTFFLRQLGLINEALSFSTPLQKVQNLPMNPSYDIFAKSEALSTAEHKQYRTIVGKLLFISRLTRPDISYTVNALGRFLENPTKIQLIAMQNLLQYLRGTKDMYLTLNCKGPTEINAYSDADWAGDKNDRKSTSGHVIYFAESPINWSTKKQKCVATSSMESEYISMADAAREAFYIKKLAENIKQVEINAILHVDNVAAQTIASGKSNASTKGAKHIDIKFHLVRDMFLNGDLDIRRVNSRDNRSDMCTKPIELDLYNTHTPSMLSVRGEC